MYEIWTQIKGKLEQINEDNNIKNINLYKRGVYFFNLNKRPICNICGSDLMFIKKGKYLIIHKCLNCKCPTNDINLKKGAPIKWKAFLPENILVEQHNRRKENNSFNIDFLINKKGLSKNEADEYINNRKKICVLNGKLNSNTSYKEKLIKKYGSEELANKYIRECNLFCKEYWIKRGYSEEEATLKISEIQKNNSKKVKNRVVPSKENLSKKIENIDLFMREKSIRCKEYWIKRGYSEEEATLKISEIQSNYSNRRNKDNFRKTSGRCLEKYILDGYSEEEAKLLLKRYQTTFSKEICIKKYGEVKGLEIFKKRQEKWQYTLHKNNNLHCGYSKISQDLFDILYKYTNNEVYYGKLNREYSIYNYITKRANLYDYTDITNKKIIEFQGDIYHGNPLLFSEDEKPNPWNDLTCKEIWEIDNKKQKLAINNGFEVMFIWEYDYKHNKTNVINECLKFLNYDIKKSNN